MTKALTARHRAPFWSWSQISWSAWSLRAISATAKVLEGVSAADVMAVLGSGQKIDVVFSEVQLSGEVDGFGLARWIREQYSDVDVILTAGARRAADEASNLCEDGPLEKPYHPQEIVRRINLLRERRRTAPKA
jgi:DNA-binding response OmpR family regulator